MCHHANLYPAPLPSYCKRAKALLEDQQAVLLESGALSKGFSQALIVGTVGLVFWTAIFGVLYRVLVYFQGVAWDPVGANFATLSDAGEVVLGNH